jgi:hypothetical protein
METRSLQNTKALLEYGSAFCVERKKAPSFDSA